MFKIIKITKMRMYLKFKKPNPQWGGTLNVRAVLLYTKGLVFYSYNRYILFIFICN